MRAHHEVGQLGQGLGQSLSRAAKGRTDSAHIYMGVSVCLPPPFSTRTYYFCCPTSRR